MKDKGTGQKNDAQAITGTISVEGAEIIIPLMNKWKQGVEKEHPGIKVIIKAANSDKSLKNVSEEKIKMAMLSYNPAENETTKNLWVVPVARDAVVPVISFDNENIQKIVLAGVTKDKLAGAFTGKIKTWGQLLGVQSNAPIEICKVYDSSGTSRTMADFLKVPAKGITGSMVYNENDIINMVAANKNAIGYCSMTKVYDLNTGFLKRNIMVLPVDLNSNHQADDNELVFDKFDDVKNAVGSGKYPSPPVRTLYLALKSVPTDAATVSFLKWILTAGQNNCPEYGFVSLSTAETSVYLKQLK